MNERASTVGELAAKVLSRGGRGVVTRIFPSSVYVRSGRDFIVLLWGGLRSPLTVNIAGDGRLAGVVPGESCSLGEAVISLGPMEVDMEGAGVFRSSLRSGSPFSLPASGSLTSAVAALRALYDVSPTGPKLPADQAFRRFVATVATPLARGERWAVHDFARYKPLLGRGAGFTPAGDDFIGGFASVYNFFARHRRWKRVALPVRSLSALTIPESAAMLSYAARGYVDELMERLILKSSGVRRGSFHRELFAVARRGHTSGMDASLGLLLCEAALKDSDEGGDSLSRCLDALWNA